VKAKNEREEKREEIKQENVINFHKKQRILTYGAPPSPVQASVQKKMFKIIVFKIKVHNNSPLPNSPSC
jgi:hypothetical protein